MTPDSYPLLVILAAVLVLVGGSIYLDWKQDRRQEGETDG